MNTNQITYKQTTPVWAKFPKIVVLGLGGGGSNAINRMIENGMQGVTFVAANTDAQALASNLAPTKIQLGPRSTRGLGAGGLPEVGQSAAEESYKELASILEGAEMVFLTAGMGGGTGTGSIPIAAKVAKSIGAVTVAVVTKPFSFELGRRQRNAEIGIDKLKEFTDTLIVIPNDRLIELAPRDLPLETAFTLADDILRQGVQGIAELITQIGLINIDFAHIKNIMKRGGGSLMAIGTGEGFNKVNQAIESALHHPLLDDIDLTKAAGIIANFTGGNDLTFREVTDALETIQVQTGNRAEIIPGVINDPLMENRVELILIITGITSEEKNSLNIQNSLSLTPEFKGSFDNLPAKDLKPAINNVSNQYQTSSLNNNQYVPELEFATNLDIPAFLRKRIVQPH